MKFLARPLEHPLARLACLILFASLLFARMPNVLLHGRLWAEEGKYFYARAAALPWYSALFMPLGGYLNLVATATPVVAHAFVPLAYTPWITTGVGLFFQCCPAILLVCSRDAWLSPWPVKLAGLLLVATAPMIEEVWLQTLHSQFHLALCCALILALDLPGPRLRLFSWALLFLAPLTGPLAGALLPLFGLRALIDRSKGRLIQAALLGVALGLQMLLFMTHVDGRSYGIGPILLACVVYLRQIVAPLLGHRATLDVADALRAQIEARHFPWLAVIVASSCFACVVLSVLRRRLEGMGWLFAAACWLGWLGYVGAIGGRQLFLIPGFGERYVFLPEVLMALVVLGLSTGPRTPDRVLFGLLTVWLIVVGFADLTLQTPMSAGPDWLTEVAAWQHDHAHPIAIWPTGWTMTLPN